MMSFDDEPSGGRTRSPEAWALVLAAAWLVAVGIGWMVLGERAGAAVAALAALLPLGLIWLAAAMARRSARAAADHERLSGEIDALRAELRALAPGHPPEEARGHAEEARRDGPRQDRPRQDGPRQDGPRRDGPRDDGPRQDGPVIVARPPRASARPEAAERAPAAAPEPPPLPAQTFVRALDFPEDADDEAGFEALARALDDPHARKLVQASQDVLTLLSQNGVYMDDLHAAPASPGLWRRFAGGVRGPSVAALAGVTDEAALELARARMARDTVFRDAAQHFLRQFDLALQRFVAHASDEEVAALAQTRTARAFMLLARVARSFE